MILMGRILTDSQLFKSTKKIDLRTVAFKLRSTY